MGRTFLKMNGLGNDFAIVETRNAPFDPSAETVRALADRATGIGFDQLIAIDPPRGPNAEARVRFWNAAGEAVGACGNGTRCVRMAAHGVGQDRPGADGHRGGRAGRPAGRRQAG